jgi:hypothetical protein
MPDIEVGPREAKVLSVLFDCSISAIRADVKVIRANDIHRLSI